MTVELWHGYYWLLLDKFIARTSSRKKNGNTQKTCNLLSKDGIKLGLRNTVSKETGAMEKKTSALHQSNRKGAMGTLRNWRSPTLGLKV